MRPTNSERRNRPKLATFSKLVRKIYYRTPNERQSTAAKAFASLGLQPAGRLAHEDNLIY